MNFLPFFLSIRLNTHLFIYSLIHLSDNLFICSIIHQYSALLHLLRSSLSGYLNKSANLSIVDLSIHRLQLPMQLYIILSAIITHGLPLSSFKSIPLFICICPHSCTYSFIHFFGHLLILFFYQFSLSSPFIVGSYAFSAYPVYLSMRNIHLFIRLMTLLICCLII